MRNSRPSPDHEYYWSEPREDVRARTAPQTREAGRQTTTSGIIAARLADRALQTLRVCRLQVPTRSRPRAQILLVDQPGWRAYKDGLHPTKLSAPSSPTAGQLQASAGHSQAGLRYQLRTVAAAIGAIRRHDACRSDAGSNRVRPSRNGQSAGQHAGSAPRVGRASWKREGGSR